MGWTEERVELLKKLWLEGLSASQIAATLGEGVTRNAVIGKVHRLKLSGRAKPTSAAPRVRPPVRPPVRRPVTPQSAGRPALPSPQATISTKPRGMPVSGGATAAVQGATALKIEEEVVREVEVVQQQAELVIPVEQRISLLELNEHTCKWPIGDPLSADFYFCGQHSDEGRPYCEFHARRAFHQMEKKKR
ncbi:MAG: GcrA family cell cycle regulator [Devosia sp.]